MANIIYLKNKKLTLLFLINLLVLIVITSCAKANNEDKINILNAGSDVSTTLDTKNEDSVAGVTNKTEKSNNDNKVVNENNPIRNNGANGVKEEKNNEDKLLNKDKLLNEDKLSNEGGIINLNDQREMKIVCEIKGEVKSPGVYSLPLNSRVNDLLKASGGETANASLLFINRALNLNDGEVILIPDKKMTKEEYDTIVSNLNSNMESFNNSNNLNINNPNDNNKNVSNNFDANKDKLGNSMDKGKGARESDPIKEKGGNSNLININTANKDELEKIPGVGPVTAQNIIDYREENGPFKTIEDIKEVNRIGDKTFLKMKDSICVN